MSLFGDFFQLERDALPMVLLLPRGTLYLMTVPCRGTNALDLSLNLGFL